MATLTTQSGRKIEFDPNKPLVEWSTHEPLGTKVREVAKALVPTSVSTRPGISANSNSPYQSASTNRRGFGWQPTRLGPTSALWTSLDLMQARSRDAARNNPWAVSAIDTFEAQVIGPDGIRPHWNIPDPKLKEIVETEFRLWATSTSADHAGLLNFYGLQALACREIFEAGEVLARTYTRPASWNLRVPFQIQLIESEQMPVWRNILNSNGTLDIPADNSVRTGIEFDKWGRRVAYHLYKENPGETMLFPFDGLQFARIPASEMLHCYKPRRAGQLRGTPHLASVLGLLLEIDQYTDASLVKKKIQTLFAGFVKKIDPNTDILPNTLDAASTSPGLPPTSPDPGTEDVKIETGTLQTLLPGEDITFPNLPAENDLEVFMKIQLHKFAVGVGMTYEQLTGDLEGVNLSSIRAGLLDVRRKLEQFQRNIMIQQFCAPIALAWMREAVLAGVIRLPGYAQNPAQYVDISWSTPGWPWIDPVKEVDAKVTEIRAGLTSREQVVAEKGDDIALVDARNAADNDRTEKLGILYDSNSTKVLSRGESRDAEDPAEGSPDASSKSKKPSLVKSSK